MLFQKLNIIVSYSAYHKQKIHFGEDSWESLGCQGDQTIPKEINLEYSLEGLVKLKCQYFGHLVQEPTHWKRHWCWERLKAKGEGSFRGRDSWMASPIQRTWVWANSKKQWRTEKPGVLQFMASQSQTQLTTEQQQQTNFRVFSKNRLWVTKPESCSCLLSVSLLVAQSCLTLWDPLDYNLPGSSVHGILQARILEWVAISFSRENSWPGDRTWVSEIAGGLFSAEASGKPFLVLQMPPNHRVVTLKRTEFYAAYFTGKNCEHNSFPIDTKSNSKLFRRMNNLYFFFLKKKKTNYDWWEQNYNTQWKEMSTGNRWKQH